MPFFIPRRLVEYEYFDGKPDEEYARIAEPYRDSIDFAFFAVNLHYTRSDYDALTPLEKSLIYKALEDKVVSETSYFNAAVTNAVGNVLRKKGTNPKPLWKKKQKKANKAVYKDQINKVLEMEKKQGKEWVKKIYEARGIKLRGRKDG